MDGWIQEGLSLWERTSEMPAFVTLMESCKNIEVELIQKVIDGVDKILSIEAKLNEVSQPVSLRSFLSCVCAPACLSDMDRL